MDECIVCGCEVYGDGSVEECFCMCVCCCCCDEVYWYVGDIEVVWFVCYGDFFWGELCQIGYCDGLGGGGCLIGF